MMKPIDKQVQNTMQQLNQAYSNAYWEQTLAHLERKEKKRRRIIGFWWIFAGAIMISSGSLIWWSIAENKRDSVTSSELQIAKIAPGENATKEEKLSKITGNGVSNNGIVSKEETSVKADNNQFASVGKIRSAQILENKLPHPKERAENLLVPENKNQTSGQTIEDTQQVKDQAEKVVTNDAQQTLVTVGEISMIPMLSIGYLNRSFIWDIERPEFKRNTIVKPIKWRLSILSELMVLTNVPGRGDEKAILGAQAGMGVRLKSGAGFFTGISAGYAIRTGTFANMLDHPTPEYVFEEKEEGFRLIPTTLSYAQSQLYAGWERGRWSGRTGIQGMYLAGATGELYNYSNEVSVEDPGVIISRVSKVSGGTISTPAFRKWVFELQAGLEFAISEKWRITGQFAYTPAGLAYPLVENKYDPVAGRYESIPGESVLKEQFLHIQVGIQYKL
jgi:hypothetical protein